ncbi:hypothetical protein LWI29_033441 [Acer saccharum]|uniref:25S rRNA (uridine-N(3))-methyltransferase BMT5-like domain-containing protein n=1 Tax=Acer saccharum TaxID=4024 RepID=A0AA39SPT0_ACESA|nr:hypothetical protein LWI29_033441 [Acer saccharum]
MPWCQFPSSLPPSSQPYHSVPHFLSPSSPPPSLYLSVFVSGFNGQNTRIQGKKRIRIRIIIRRRDEPEKWRKHYSSKQRILLVGEGDFSFSLSLARAFGSAHNMAASSIDTQELEERGCKVLYGVDAKEMSQHFFLKTQKFDRIIYNFPHVGFPFHENSYCQIQLNKGLVKGFLKNAKVMLKEGKGAIHVSHKEGDPYDKWELVNKAEKIGLIIHQVVPFCKQDYPGYHNKRAQGNNSDDPFPLGDCSTYKFRKLAQNGH